MSYTTIEEYNNYLVIKKKDVNIIEYVKKINKLTFKIDISFMNDFIELVYKDTFCIHHSMLKKYGVSNLTGGSSEVNVIMKQYGFIIDKDYQLRNVPELRIQGGTSIKNNYYLHPDTFKICCQRAKNTLIYSKYFVLLEKGMTYYRDYQNLKEINILKEKYESKMEKQNIKLDELNNQIKTLLIHSNKQMEKSDEILKVNCDIKKELKISHEKIDNITEELMETKEELEDTNNNVKLIATKLDIAVIDRVSRPKTLSTLEYFIVMKSNTNTDYKYYIIRGQKGYANGQKNKLDEYTEIKTIECCPNANILWRLLKEQLINNLEYYRNRLNIIDINEDTFLEKIDIIYNTRKIVEIN